MSVVAEVTMSLDGYVAGPDQTLEEPLGKGGEQLHEWLFGLASFRERHGGTGGEANDDSALVDDSVRSTGAVVMGRRMFSGGSGPWESDPNADGWWGEEPPFGVPVFVVTHHARKPLEKGATTFHFVTDGVDAAIESAESAAGDRNVSIGGGADVIQQAFAAGLVDELRLHVAPLLLGGGVRLFDGTGAPAKLELERVVNSSAVTHIYYRVPHAEGGRST